MKGFFFSIVRQAKRFSFMHVIYNFNKTLDFFDVSFFSGKRTDARSHE